MMVKWASCEEAPRSPGRAPVLGARRPVSEREVPARAECRDCTRFRQARDLQEQLREFSRRLLRSHEEERRLISRELHDVLGQNFAGINLSLAALKGDGAGVPKELRERIARTLRLVHRSMRTVHQFARDLRPSVLDDLGIGPALQSLAADFGLSGRVRVLLALTGEAAGLDGDSRTALFRVAQEALANIRRHARARNVRMTLQALPGAIRMEVWNDGRTFDAKRMLDSRKNRRLGLLCMQERLEMVGGSFAVESSPGKGTTVRATVPLPEGRLMGTCAPAGSGQRRGGPGRPRRARASPTRTMAPTRATATRPRNP